MSNTYPIMGALYAVMAALMALDAAGVSLGVLPAPAGLTWLRVHLITLGLVLQVLFGALPLLVGGAGGQPRPRARWDIWVTLNAGLVTLWIGVPSVNLPLVLLGGSLIFIAVGLLLAQLWGIRNIAPPTDGFRFYAAALGSLFIGIVVGTGVWLGWDVTVLNIASPREVHVHANGFGFMGLTFAGLIVDLYPGMTGRSLAWPASRAPIFVLMALGVVGLVAGPWIDFQPLIGAGLLLHGIATVWLLANVIRPLVSDRAVWPPGLLHMVTSYVWFFAPLVASPPVLFGAPGFSAARIEANAPVALIYGWVLLFSYGALPYIFRRVFTFGGPADAGGNWFSLIAVHLGAVALWASVFAAAYEGWLQGIAFLLWGLSTIPILRQFWRSVLIGMQGASESLA